MKAWSESMPAVYLKPGEMFVSAESHVVSTLLGSCVAVSIASRSHGIGAICHALLPSCKSRNQCCCSQRFRFMDCAIIGMLEEFARRGVQRGMLEAKIFGGADMFQAKETGPTVGVGSLNVAKAMEILVRERVRIVASDVGGRQGRKLYFLTQTGEVFLKRLNRVAEAGGAATLPAGRYGDAR